ncbi:hypothetical protein IWW55_005984, partial [Coemansia sp. RSA 2706]
SLTAAYQAFPLRTKGLEQLRLRISEKSAVLRLAVVTACTGIVRSHGAHIDPSDRRNADLFAPLIEIAKTGLTDAQPSVREPARELLEAADEAEEANDDVDSVMFVESSPANKPHMRIKELRTPARERMSLGLIDFSKMEIGPSLLDIGSAPERVVEAAALEVTEPESCLESELHDTTTATPCESQVTAVMPDSIEHSLILAASDQPTACIDTSESKSPAKIASSQVLTPDKTPRMSPSLHTSTGTDTPQRLNKVELCLRRLTDNSGVNEALFRCLARFAKEESSTVWMGEAQGGRAYLDRILGACLGWLQNPAEGRDAVFTKDSCFDVLRVLVRRKSQYFTLDAARRLLLEVLRNRFFESTIL